jgi:hypothetical protein
VEPADDDGNESTSSGEGMFAYEDDGSDISAMVARHDSERNGWEAQK